MTQKTVILAGIIGLVFGFLFSATLGIDFFGTNDPSNDVDNNVDENSLLDEEAEAFRIKYNLTESIYDPITGEEAYAKIENGDSFILYAGRHTCPYCQQYVPVLMEAATNQGIETIYHIDTLDSQNSDFIYDVGVSATPTTFIYVDGVLVETVVGYQTLSTTEQLLLSTLP